MDGIDADILYSIGEECIPVKYFEKCDPGDPVEIYKAVNAMRLDIIGVGQIPASRADKVEQVKSLLDQINNDCEDNADALNEIANLLPDKFGNAFLTNTEIVHAVGELSDFYLDDSKHDDFSESVNELLPPDFQALSSDSASVLHSLVSLVRLFNRQREYMNKFTELLFERAY